jgi:hypothetical protein
VSIVLVNFILVSIILVYFQYHFGECQSGVNVIKLFSFVPDDEA